ncbi:ATP:guanido C-terminal catalytic domain-containing protein [Cryptosporidium andersoni]|uniref:ATP:guanido C-terminal catalytic domain-containing protein n=1 Tax=Cryptosporidium andersoni TaxID=117008 RepID=A0A1J4MR22_9CRYT|nr:ATP:guanido C-terminal catalytic domain-containing protein [Cryptosporidium andersoni]
MKVLIIFLSVVSSIYIVSAYRQNSLSDKGLVLDVVNFRVSATDNLILSILGRLCPTSTCKKPSEYNVETFGTALENYPNLSKHYCYMAKVLTKSMYGEYYNLKTSNGFTFDQVIQTGVDNPGHPFITNVGAVAGDEESFELFKEFFENIVEVRHGFMKHQIQESNLNIDELIENTIDEKYVVSVRVRTSRSVSGLPFSPATNRYQRRQVEKIVSSALESLTGDLAGKYYPLSSLTEEETQRLIDDHLLFQKPESPLLLTAGMARDWPDARGIFHNEKKDFLVWINEEDHIRIISMQNGSDIHAVFSRFSRAVSEIEASMLINGYKFAFDKHFGYLATCPSNLGTGLRASALVKIPLLEKHPRFMEIFKPLRMQRRGTYGVDSQSIDGIHDISNSDRMGSTEVELVNTFIKGATKIIELEKALERGEDIYDDIDKIVTLTEKISSSI